MEDSSIKHDTQTNNETQEIDDDGNNGAWKDPNYKLEDFTSKPYLSTNCTLQENIIEFLYSFGYDGSRRNNLCVLNEQTVAFISGNFVHIYNKDTKELQFLRSLSGIGLGHLCKHPNENILAVGERGENPMVVLYEYPNFSIKRILKGGTDAAYNYISFSPDGNWLITQGGEPDNSLTIWDWRFERLLLKEKVGRDTWKAESNPLVSGEIITSGANYIMFWMITETFTGLRLKGYPGKFGSYPFCDICTFCALPKGKVLSPNQANNLYVWRGEEISMEIRRSGNLSLHDANIVYLEYSKSCDEIISVGQEGIYKVWDFTRINNAPKKIDYVEIQPSYQKKIQDEYGTACPMYFQSQISSKPLSTMYYMQDKCGSIWLVEMAVKSSIKPPKRVLMAHESPIGDVAPSPTDHYFATIGAEGKLHVYDIETKNIIMFKKFKSGGTSLLWLPLSVDSTGSVLIVGFLDGSIRTVVVPLKSDILQTERADSSIIVIQAFKPHNQAITAVTLNPNHEKMPIVVTCSLDKKVFIHWLKPLDEYLKLEPYGFVEMSGAIHYLTWSPFSDAILIATSNGIIAEIIIPDILPKPPPNTYRIFLENRITYFSSIKSQILRKNAIQRNFLRKNNRREKRIKKEKEKEEELKRKMMDEKEHKEPIKYDCQHDKINKKTKKLLKEIKKQWNESRVLGRAEEKLDSIDIEEQYEEDKSKTIKFINNLPLTSFLREVSREMEKEQSELFKRKSEDNESSVEDSASSSEVEQQVSEDEISEDEEVPPLYVPPESPPIFCMKYIDKDSFWISVGAYDCGYIYQYKLGESAPYKYTRIPIGDIEMTSYIDLCGGEYLVFGLGNGGIQVVKKNLNDFLDFSDYYLSTMHDNKTGKVTKLCFTFDERYLISIGEDANIFLYQVNVPQRKFVDSFKLTQPSTLVPLRLRMAEEDIQPETLSLEDSLILEENIKRKKMGEERINYLKGQICDITLRFQILLELNESLPPSQKLPESFFVFDEDFKESNVKSMQERRETMTKALELEYLKEKEKRDAIYKHYIQPVRVFKIYLFGIENANKITSFYQPKITMSFIQAEQEAELSIVDILSRGSHRQLMPLKIPKASVPHKLFKRSRLEVRPLFRDEDEIVTLLDRASKAIFIRLSKRRERRKLLKNVLTLFMEEKEWKKKKFFKDIELRKEEPIDMRYVLKSDPNYSLNNLTKLTTEKKFYQLITTKRKIHDLMSHFNSQVLKLREKKSKIVALYNASLKDKNTILSEFSDANFPKDPKKISLVEPLEFPELYLMDFPPEFPHKQENKDNYYDHLYCELYEINKKLPINCNNIIKECEESIERLHGVMSNEQMETAGLNILWEKEFLEERKEFLLSEFYKKGQIVEKMISSYDEELEKLVAKKIEYEVKILYLKFFYQKYFEELQIIRSHQLLEKQIEKKLEVFFLQKHIYILRINIVNKKINNCLNEIVMSNRRIEKISKAFVALIAKITPKLKRHLNNLFKKKWKPEKIRTEDDESSTSEEEEEEEEEDEDEEDEEDEGGELYIEDLLAMDHRPVDERTKPEGLDDYTFDETFNLRDLRQAEEKRIFDTKATIQEHHERIAELRNTLLCIQTFIAFYKVKLSYVLEEKHKELNSVRTIAILDASQMQHFDIEKNEFPAVKDTILFPLYNLRNLEARKRQLKEDIINVQLKKQETVKHVKRLDLDINFLRSKLLDLKKKINKAKLEKFGMPVNLDKLEENILLKIIKELKYNTLPFHMKFHVDILKLQKEFEKIDLSMTEHVKKNTYEELKYGALLEQKRMYEKCLEKLKFRKPVEYISLEDLNKNIHELLAVVKIQEDRIECLENEINRLKYISYIPDPTKKKKIVPIKEVKDLLDEEHSEGYFEDEDEFGSFEEPPRSEFEVFSKMSEHQISEEEEEEYNKIILEDVSEYLTMEEESEFNEILGLEESNFEDMKELMEEEESKDFTEEVENKEEEKREKTEVSEQEDGTEEVIEIGHIEKEDEERDASSEGNEKSAEQEEIEKEEKGLEQEND